jgi:hypothetical protein
MARAFAAAIFTTAAAKAVSTIVVVTGVAVAVTAAATVVDAEGINDCADFCKWFLNK